MTPASLMCLTYLITVSLQQPAAQAPVSAAQEAPAHIIAKYSVRTDAPIHCLFLDKPHHRLATQVGDDPNKPALLKWVRRDSLATLISMTFQPNEVLAVDFRRRRVFSSSGAIYGDGVYLHANLFSGSTGVNGDLDKVSNDAKMGVKFEDRVRVKYFIPGKRAGESFRVLFPVNGDVGAPLAWGGVYSGNKLIKRFEVGYLPKQILYVPTADQLWIVHNGQMRNLEGRTIPLPNKISPEEKADHGGPQWGGPVSVVDTDLSGKNAYYIDGRTRSVYKFSLTSGAVHLQRSLPIIPKSIVVDGSRNLIYLLDDSGKRYIAVRAF